MPSKDPDKFDIRFDDAAPEPIDPEDLENRGIDRLRRRVTLGTILIACLLIGLLLAGYFDLKRRMSAVDTTGSTQVQKVSKTLESSFSSVSVQLAKLEENVSGRLDSVEKTLGATTGRMDKLEQRLKRLEKEKAGQSALSSAMAKQKADLAAFEKRFDAAIEEVSAEREQQQAALASATEAAENAARQVDSLQTEVKALEAEVETFASLRTKMEVLDLARKNDKEALEKKLRGTAAELENRIETLSGRLTELRRKLAAQNAKPSVKPAPSGKQPPASTPSPSSKTDTGKIIEQDLK
jgi:chromosome segregation ATPase